MKKDNIHIWIYVKIYMLKCNGEARLRQNQFLAKVTGRLMSPNFWYSSDIEANSKIGTKFAVICEENGLKYVKTL